MIGYAAALLEVDPIALTTALCERVIETGTGARIEVFHKPSTAAQVIIHFMDLFDPSFLFFFFLNKSLYVFNMVG